MTHDTGKILPVTAKSREAFAMLRAALAQLALGAQATTEKTLRLRGALDAYEATAQRRSIPAPDLGSPRGDRTVVSVARRNGLTFKA